MGVVARVRRWFQRQLVDGDTQREAEAIAEQRENTRAWPPP